MKKNKCNRKRFLSNNIQRSLFRLCSLVFSLLLNSGLIFGQCSELLLLRSVGAQSGIYLYQPEKYTPVYPLAGSPGSSVCKSKTVSLPGTIFSSSACLPIAKVQPSGAFPVSGTINVCVTLDAAQMYYNGSPYVQRHFDMEPVLNPASATGTVTLYFTDAEFVIYNTNNPTWSPLPTLSGGGNADPNRANLKITQFHGTPTSSPSAPGMYTGATQFSDVNDADIVWNGASWSVTFNTTGFSGFYVHTSRVVMPAKIFLQGAYNTGLARHRNNTASWVGALNAGAGGNALNQPFAGAPFNYPGTESVASFAASTNSGTDIMDWVLLELRDGASPATVISRRAAFVRCDGKVVDLDGVSDVSFNNVDSGDYHLVIRHRNHLAIRTSATINLDASLGAAPPALYDFSSSQSEAYQNPSVTGNTAMKDLGGGVFGMWGGNANGMTSPGSPSVRTSGVLSLNDYLYLTSTALGGNVTLILTNKYDPADMNLDASVRASGIPSINDYSFLISAVLGGDVIKIISQHQ